MVFTVHDARQIINNKKRGKFRNRGSLNTSSGRKSFPSQKFNFGNQRNFRGNNRNAGFVSRHFRQSSVRQNQNVSRGNNRFRRGSFNKVQVSQDGQLKVSRRNNPISNVAQRMNLNRFVSDLSGLTVTTQNRKFMMRSEEPMDNGDELESMTLQDIPELSNMKNVPLFLQKKKPSRWQAPESASSSSSAMSRLSDSSHTMIADSIASSSSSQLTWRVIVSNLQPTVTQSDVVELFGHFAIMKSAQLVKPGAAVIEYFTQEDAMRAYDMYNDRLLDGQPMVCDIESDLAPNRAPVSLRLGEKFNTSSFKVPQRSKLDSSRKVSFTVQLP